jgi:hypothetical protein
MTMVPVVVEASESTSETAPIHFVTVIILSPKATLTPEEY